MDENELIDKATASVTEKLGPIIAGGIKTQMEAVLADQAAKNKEINDAAKQVRFKTFGEFLGTVRDFRLSGKFDERLIYVNKGGKIIDGMVSKTLTEGVDSAGGFLVPEVYLTDVKMLAMEMEIVRPNGATIIPMATDTVNIPRVDETSRASNYFGGCLGYWIDEAATKTSSEPKFGQTKLIAKKLAGYTKIYNELLADSAVPAEGLIKKLFGQTWGFMEDEAFINGSGVGQPLGIMNSGALITVTRSAAGRVYFLDLASMIARLLPGSFGKAVWLVGHDVFPELITLTTSNTTLGTGANAIWINSQMGAANPLPGTIFGRPFFLTEKMQALGTTGDIGLFDFSYYLIGDRQPLTIDVSTHVGFVTDTTYFRFVLRVDGQPWVQSPLTPHRGTNTLSPFVVLSTGT